MTTTTLDPRGKEPSACVQRLDKIASQLSNCTERGTEVIHRLDLLADEMFGSSSDVEQDIPSQAPRDGAVGRLEDCGDGLNDILSRIEGRVSRLEVS